MRHRYPLLCLALLPGCLAPRAWAAPGFLDPLFGSDGVATNRIDSGGQQTIAGIAVQPDGKIVVAGYAYSSNNVSQWAVVRYATNGILDSTFSGDGKVFTVIGGTNYASGLAIQSNGAIVVTGTSGPSFSQTAFTVARYTSNGVLDASFGGGLGFVTSSIAAVNWAGGVAIQTNGRIVVAGTAAIGGANANDFAALRYTTNGVLDTTFSTDGKVNTDILADDNAYAVVLQSDQKIVVGGEGYNGSNEDFVLVRYTTAGALDTTFSGDGKVRISFSNNHDICNCLAIQADGKILAGGAADLGPNRNFAIARFTTAGALDTSFSGDGKVTTHIWGNDAIYGLAIQPDGKIVAAGYAGSYFALARYTTNGVLDASFGSGGVVTTFIGAYTSYGFCTALQGDGKILVGGTASDDGTAFSFAVARYGGVVEDTDGDYLLDSWELANWGTITGHNTLEDSDHDGYGDLLEEAFGLNPAQPDASGLPVVTTENGYLTMTITKHAGVTYSIESAGTLLPSLPNSFNPYNTTVLINDPTTLKVRDNVLIGSAPTRFMRVNVTAAP